MFLIPNADFEGMGAKPQVAPLAINLDAFIHTLRREDLFAGS